MEEIKRSLNESIIKIRVDLQNSKLKKSGKNRFGGFDYFELSDFLPRLNELMLQEGVNDLFNIKGDEVSLTLIKGEERQEYTIPFVMYDTPTNRKSDKNGEVYEVKSMQDIQYLGALNTYYKRYIYLNAFGITDGDVIDSLDNSENKKEAPKKEVIKSAEQLLITPNQIEIISKVYTGDNLNKLLASCGIKELKEMTLIKASEICKKLRELAEKQEKKEVEVNE